MRRRAILAGLILLIGVVVLFLIAGKRSTNPLPRDVVANRVVVDKSERVLRIFQDDRLLKSYEISLGGDPTGHKKQEGDNRTPEGEYDIDFHKRDSAYHRALHISYPNPEDTAQAGARGVSPGGDIMIHGLPNGLGFIGRAHLLRDWTEGCIAVTNSEIEELWRAVPDGTRILIQP